MLKKTVPTSCTALLHQSSSRGRKTPLWTYCNEAAEVKKIEPTKKTRPSTVDPTSSTKPGMGPTRKQVEPIAKRTPIHHDARRGPHQPCSCSFTGRTLPEREVG